MVVCAQNMEWNIIRLILDIQKKKPKQMIIKQLTTGLLQLYPGDQGCLMNDLFMFGSTDHLQSLSTVIISRLFFFSLDRKFML